MEKEIENIAQKPKNKKMELNDFLLLCSDGIKDLSCKKDKMIQIDLIHGKTVLGKSGFVFSMSSVTGGHQKDIRDKTDIRTSDAYTKMLSLSEVQQAGLFSDDNYDKKGLEFATTCNNLHARLDYRFVDYRATEMKEKSGIMHRGTFDIGAACYCVSEFEKNDGCSASSIVKDMDSCIANLMPATVYKHGELYEYGKSLGKS